MSAIAEATTAMAPPDSLDPYYYGFRDEPTLQPDGSFKTVRVALTLEDHLHPHEGDQFMEGNIHDLLRSYLRDVCRVRVQGDTTALVLSDTAIYWDDPQLGHHAPDVAVIFGIRQQRPQWKAFHVAREGTRPKVITELVTPRYRKTDLVDKFAEYHQARVPTYVIIDRERDDDPWTIKPFHWNPQRYVPQPLEADGRYWLADLNLWLAVDGQNIRCFDGVSGEEIGDYSALTLRTQQLQAVVDAEKVRADYEKARADASETRLREIEAELARLKGS